MFKSTLAIYTRSEVPMYAGEPNVQHFRRTQAIEKRKESLEEYLCVAYGNDCL